MNLRDEHFVTYLLTLQAYRTSIGYAEMAVMNSCLQQALESSMVTPMSCYIWKKRKLMEKAKTTPDYSGYMRVVGYPELESFCKDYNWEYSEMEDKWEDLRTDPLE